MLLSCATATAKYDYDIHAEDDNYHDDGDDYYPHCCFHHAAPGAGAGASDGMPCSGHTGAAFGFKKFKAA